MVTSIFLTVKSSGKSLLFRFRFRSLSLCLTHSHTPLVHSLTHSKLTFFLTFQLVSFDSSFKMNSLFVKRTIKFFSFFRFSRFHSARSCFPPWKIDLAHTHTHRNMISRFFFTSNNKQKNKQTTKKEKKKDEDSFMLKMKPFRLVHLAMLSRTHTHTPTLYCPLLILWKSFLLIYVASPSLPNSFNPHIDFDLTDEHVIWSFYYFFYSKKLKRVVFFACRAGRLVCYFCLFMFASFNLFRSHLQSEILIFFFVFALETI